MQNNYKGLIFTNHAFQRMRERRIKQGDVWTTWRKPDQSRYAKNKGAWIYYKTFGRQKIEVVAKQNEKKEWIVISVWSKHAKKIRKNHKSYRRSFLGSIIKFLRTKFR